MLRRRLLATLCTLALCTGFAGATSSAQAGTCPVATPFSDMDAACWAAQAVANLAAKGVVNGYADGTFHPDAEVTRAEFVKMLDVVLGLEPAGAGTPFQDVPASAWYAPYVSAAVSAGIVQGLTPTTFGPDAPVTREQVAVLLSRALKLTKTVTLNFSDDNQIDGWAISGVEETVAAGYMQGFPDGTFQPLGETTRAQAAVLLNRVLNGGGPSPVAAGQPLPPDFYGVNYDYQGAAAFSQVAVGPLLAALSPGTLRWPGGTEADYFDWHTGLDMAKSNSYSFTLSDLLAAYQATGATPIFDLNVLANPSDPSDQLQMLQTAAAMGLPVRYVEIGNELYGGVGRSVFPDGSAYASTVSTYVQALHAAFPGVQVAADACYSPTPCQPDWNQQLLAGATGAGAPDALILHTYPGQTYSTFSDADVPGMLEGAYAGAQTLQQGVSALGGKPVWVTEYNFRGPYKMGQNTLANPAQTSYARELFVAAYALLLPRIPGIALVDGWSALGGGEAYSYWTAPPGPQLTPAGQAVAAVDAAAHGATSWSAIDVQNGPTLPGGDPAVVGDAFIEPDGFARAVLVNLGATAVTVPWPAGVPYEQVTGDPASQMNAAPAPQSGETSQSGLSLPAYSLTLVGASLPN